jgi:hypothetical protein
MDRNISETPSVLDSYLQASKIVLKIEDYVFYGRFVRLLPLILGAVVLVFFNTNESMITFLIAYAITEAALQDRLSKKLSELGSNHNRILKEVVVHLSKHDVNA